MRISALEASASHANGEPNAEPGSDNAEILTSCGPCGYRAHFVIARGIDGRLTLTTGDWQVGGEASIRNVIVWRNFPIDDQEAFLYGAPMKLKQIIRDSGLRQNWVADQVGLHPVRFNMILADKAALPSEYIAPLAKILRLSGDEVLQAIQSETSP